MEKFQCIIILIFADENRCPNGWFTAGEHCIQLQFVANGIAQSSIECKRLGAQLVNVVDEDGEPLIQLLDDLSSILEVNFFIF